MWAETYPRDLALISTEVEQRSGWGQEGEESERERRRERDDRRKRSTKWERRNGKEKEMLVLHSQERKSREKEREREWGRKFCSTLSESQRNTLTAVKQSIRRQRVRETEWERERKRERERERGRAKNKKGYWTSWSACSTNSWMPAERGLHSWLMSLLSYEIQAYSKQAREVLPTRLSVV